MNSTITDNTYSGLQIVVCLWKSLWYGNLFPHLVQIIFEKLLLWYRASWQRRHRFDPLLFLCAVRNLILSNRLLHFERCSFGHVLRCVSIDSITFSHMLHTSSLEGLHVCLSMAILLRNVFYFGHRRNRQIPFLYNVLRFVATVSID